LSEMHTRPLKYRKVYQAISEAIISGKYQSGEKLPTEHDLVDHFGTSRATIIRALRELERNNLVRRRQGSGSYVMENSRQFKQPLGILNQVQPGHFSESIQEQPRDARCLFIPSIPAPIRTPPPMYWSTGKLAAASLSRSSCRPTCRITIKESSTRFSAPAFR